MEHFVTLFDSRFAILGLALYQSLMEHRPDSHLWVLAMDQEIEAKLVGLALPKLTVIPLRDVESDKLLRVKADRTAGEYCWTLTPFTITAVFDRDPSIKRVTYVDADIAFFDDPMILIQEMIDADKHVLITEHAYDPKYDQTATSGRFCVQFMTFNRSEPALKVCHWWQDRCVEWCFARFENNKFGDQKYLDAWPGLFGASVHILKATEKTLAPWNVHFVSKSYDSLTPVIYHFHGLRFASNGKLVWYDGYYIGSSGCAYYSSYICRLVNSVALLGDSTNLPTEPPPNIRTLVSRFRRRLKGIRYVSSGLKF